MRFNFVMAFLLGMLMMGTVVLAECQPDPDCIARDPACAKFAGIPWADPGLGAGTCCVEDTCTVTCEQFAGSFDAGGNGDPENPDWTDLTDQEVNFNFTLQDTSQEDNDFSVTLSFDWQSDGNCGGTINDGPGDGTGNNQTENGIYDSNTGTCWTTFNDLPGGRLTQNTLSIGGLEIYQVFIPTSDGDGLGYTIPEHVGGNESEESVNDTRNNTAQMNSSQGSQGTPAWMIAAVYVNYTNVSGISLYDSTGTMYPDHALVGGPIFIKNTSVYMKNDSSSTYLISVDTSNLGGSIRNPPWNLSNSSLALTGSLGSYRLIDASLNLIGGLAKQLLIQKGTGEEWAFCCPSATTASEVNNTCPGIFYTSTEITGPDSNTYFVCSGMTSSGAGSQGDTNLVINDSAEGVWAATSTPVEFYAYYYNVTDDSPLTSSDSTCNIDGPVSWINMTYDAGDTRWEYNYTGGYGTTGLKSWDVSCNTTATSHFNLLANDTVNISSTAYNKDNQTFNVTINGTDPSVKDMKCYDGNTGSFITVTPTAFSTTNIIC
ncbi:MAG: hypothetical protein GOV02_02460, partial [Candidatus Aenigmarchaeota archaeon]|nr:hypothetical protein [Candidatus Aenigmarchaeota archaeon]